MMGNYHARCGAGEKPEVETPEAYLSLFGIQCYIKNDEQKKAVSEMNVGQDIIVRGKCTDVGEVLGYSLDIDSFN